MQRSLRFDALYNHTIGVDLGISQLHKEQLPDNKNEQRQLKSQPTDDNRLAFCIRKSGQKMEKSDGVPSIVPKNSFQPTGQMKTQVEELERLPSEVTLKTKEGDNSKEKVGTQVEELERQFSEVTIKLEETT